MSANFSLSGLGYALSFAPTTPTAGLWRNGAKLDWALQFSSGDYSYSGDGAETLNGLTEALSVAPTIPSAGLYLNGADGNYAICWAPGTPSATGSTAADRLTAIGKTLAKAPTTPTAGIWINGNATQGGVVCVSTGAMETLDISWATTQKTLQKTIPSYLYVEYNDDDNLQAFVDSYNDLVQEYVDWFNTINLPVYTGLSGDLLGWVGAGLYGIPRPILSSGGGIHYGALNTTPLNTIALNARKTSGATDVYVMDDDLYKRIITWNFYKGDGMVFSVPWLKRRIMRFLSGTNGVDPGVSQTYQISVACPGSHVANITISQSYAVHGGTLGGFARVAQFVAALDSGVLQLPFQYSFSVTVKAS